MTDAPLDEAMAFALTLLLAAVALYALSIMMMARARSHARRRTAEINRRVKELDAACAELSDKLAEQQKELKQRDAEHGALASEIGQFRKLCAAAAADNFQVIHEVGMPEGRARPFEVEIVLSEAAMADGTAKINPAAWSVRNVAHVWAADGRDAVRAAGRAFPDRYGFVVTRVLAVGTAAAGKAAEPQS